MLLATPKELFGKINYESGYPAPSCELTDAEKETKSAPYGSTLSLYQSYLQKQLLYSRFNISF